MKRSSRRVLVALLTILGAWLVFQLLQPAKDDEQFLLQLPGYVAGLAEKKQHGEIRKFIDPSYSDSKGRGYDELAQLVRALTLRPGEISIYTMGVTLDLAMDLHPPWAQLKFKAAMARGPRDPGFFNRIPEHLNIYDFTVELKKTGSGWMVVKATWEPTFRTY